jgi:hypothetical protein
MDLNEFTKVAKANLLVMNLENYKGISMYSLINATVLSYATDSQYETVDLSNTPINVIYSIYSEVYLTLSNPYLTSNVYVDFNAVKPQISGYQGLIYQWLANIGNATLPTIAAIPSTTVLYARYSDATHAGYKANVCKIGFQNPLNYPVDLLPDLQITRPGYSTNLQLINQYCLTTVNGFLHQTDYDGTYAYIQHGASTMRKSNLNNFGILSFLDIGTITTFPIDTTKVYADTSNTGMSLKNKIYLNINQSITGNSVMLSLGGYLVFPQPNVFYQVSDSIFCLHTDALPLLQRYFESSQYIDLSSLGLSQTALYPGAINASELLSDAVIKLYLQLPQSFWIVVNSPTLNFNPVYIQNSKLPGSFISYIKPINPLMVGYGRMAEYWSVYEDGQWSMNVDNSFLVNYDFATNPLGNTQNINSAAIPGNQYSLSQGYTLQIHT